MTQSTQEAPASDLLMGFFLSLLSPFLTAGSISDPDLARRAAAETIAAYQAAAADQLVTVTQIVAFALTSLDALRLSLPEDLALSMRLKLRGNANALSRSSQRATAMLDIQRRDTQRRRTVPAEPAPAEPAPAKPGLAEPDLAEILAALEAVKIGLKQAQVTPPTQPARQPDPSPRQPDPSPRNRSALPLAKPPAQPAHQDLCWATAMTEVATEYATELATIAPRQRGTHLARIGALSEIAHLLGRGKAPPLKARLLATTMLHT